MSMRTPLQLSLAIFLAWTGCGSPPPAPPAPPMPPMPPASPSSTAPPPPTSATPRGKATETVTIPTDGRASVLGLEIRVVENVEKRETDGNSFMRIRLHVKAGADEGDVALTSGEVHAAWQRYEIEYTGGWRQDLTLKITRLP